MFVLLHRGLVTSTGVLSCFIGIDVGLRLLKFWLVVVAPARHGHSRFGKAVVEAIGFFLTHGH